MKEYDNWEQSSNKANMDELIVISMLPERVKEIRNRLGLNQDELATRLGCNPSYISNIERGKQMPRATAPIVKKINDLWDE